MSFLIKGGYDVFRKQILNVSLKRADVWTHGHIMVRQHKYVGELSSQNENIIELVRYDDMHALVLNNAIIYEDKKLFTYKLDLFYKTPPVNVNTWNMCDMSDYIKNYVDYSYITYNEMKQVDTNWGGSN
jgi:hypothetical protein